MATDLTAGGFYAVIPAPVLKDPHLRPVLAAHLGGIAGAGHGAAVESNQRMVRK